MTHSHTKLFIPDWGQAISDDCSLGEGSCSKANLKIGISQITASNVEEDIVRVRQVLGLSCINLEGSM